MTVTLLLLLLLCFYVCIFVRCLDRKGLDEIAVGKQRKNGVASLDLMLAWDIMCETLV